MTCTNWYCDLPKAQRGGKACTTSTDIKENQKIYNYPLTEVQTVSFFLTFPELEYTSVWVSTVGDAPFPTLVLPTAVKSTLSPTPAVMSLDYTCGSL